jgi:hypothetical protein
MRPLSAIGNPRRRLSYEDEALELLRDEDVRACKFPDDKGGNLGVLLQQSFHYLQDADDILTWVKVRTLLLHQTETTTGTPQMQCNVVVLALSTLAGAAILLWSRLCTHALELYHLHAISIYPERNYSDLTEISLPTNTGRNAARIARRGVCGMCKVHVNIHFHTLPPLGHTPRLRIGELVCLK